MRKAILAIVLPNLRNKMGRSEFREESRAMLRRGTQIFAPILLLISPTAALFAQTEPQSESPSSKSDYDKRDKFIVATPDAIGEVLKYNGFDFKSQTYQDKTVLVVDIDGITTVIHFYGKGPEFSSIQLYSGFVRDKDSSVSTMNEWNSEYRFTRAYIDDEGDPVLEMDINFAFGGISERQLEDNLLLWELSVQQFRKFVYNDNGQDAKKKTEQLRQMF